VDAQNFSYDRIGADMMGGELFSEQKKLLNVTREVMMVKL